MSRIEFSNVSLCSREFGPVSLTLGPGEITLLCGLSGSGKSTLCQLLCGRQEPASGTISGREAVRLGYIAHDFENQLVGSTVAEDLELGSRDKDVLFSEPVEALMGPLRKRLSMDPHALAASEQQALLLSGLVGSGARFLVLDESLSLLDAPKRHEFVKVLQELARLGLGSLVVSHQASLLSEVDRVLILEGGGILFDGPAEDVPADYVGRAGLREFGEDEVLNRGPSLGQHSGDREFAFTAPFGEVTLAAGESLVIGGFAGAGKSRVLNALYGLCEYAGWASVGKGFSSCLLRQHVAPSFWRSRTSLEWQASVAHFQPLEDLYQEQLYAMFPGPWREKAPHQLSNGQLRFFASLCLLAQNPDVLFLDQPFQGLDGPLRSRLGTCLRRFLALGRRLVLTTHAAELVEGFGHRAVWLDEGQCVWWGETGSGAWHDFCSRF